VQRTHISTQLFVAFMAEGLFPYFNTHPATPQALSDHYVAT
jgi:hypothetical protein